MAKKKPDDTDVQPSEPPAEVPVPEPPPDEMPVYDHTVLYGVDSIVSNAEGFDRSFYLTHAGRRYVHVGETPDGRWIYRPD